MPIITDFHTHILPAIDDGATNTEEALAMLQSLYDQGVRRVVLTPHFYPQRTSITDFLQRRDAAMKTLLAIEDRPKDMELILAAEVYMHEAVLNIPYDELRKLCIPATDYILTELPYGVDLTPSVLRRVSALIYNYDCVPVLAHIERYFHRIGRKAVSELLDEGCRLQINLNHWERLSPLKKYRLKQHIKKQEIDCCGSDCHNMTERPPLFIDSATRLDATFGKRTANAILSAERLF